MLLIIIMLIDMLAHISIFIVRLSQSLGAIHLRIYHVFIYLLLRSFVIATNDEVQLVLARFSKSGEEKELTEYL